MKIDIYYHKMKIFEGHHKYWWFYFRTYDATKKLIALINK